MRARFSIAQAVTALRTSSIAPPGGKNIRDHNQRAERTQDADDEDHAIKHGPAPVCVDRFRREFQLHADHQRSVPDNIWKASAVDTHDPSASEQVSPTI